MEIANKITEAEFIELINSCRSKMYKTAMAILKNDDDACDAIQEALSQVKNGDIKSKSPIKIIKIDLNDHDIYQEQDQFDAPNVLDEQKCYQHIFYFFP